MERDPLSLLERAYVALSQAAEELSEAVSDLRSVRRQKVKSLLERVEEMRDQLRDETRWGL